jgi:CheY-like chemotaxis protein
MTDTDKQSVMLVDDDKFLLDMYSMKFSQNGYTVHPCFSVDEALGTLRTGVVPSVIVFDITMPGQDGYAFLQHIHDEKLAAGSKLIALTNESGDAEKKRAEEFGVRRYIVKATMIPSEVVAAVKEELGKK